MAFIVGSFDQTTTRGTDASDYIYDANVPSSSTETRIIYAGGGDDRVFGLYGRDYLFGQDGNDKLYGGPQDDYLVGGRGYFDEMYGGQDNDIYAVLDSNDRVIEHAHQGTDTVWSFISDYTLTANVENLVLRSGARNGTGNNLDNTITGNNQDNRLYGGSGTDTLLGGKGDDRLLGAGRSDADRDILTGGAGNDTFVIGDFYSNFYTNAGDSDYALITDMAYGDQIVLDNGNYSLTDSPIAGITGTAVYEGSELIVVVQGVSSQQLTFRDQRYLDILELNSSANGLTSSRNTLGRGSLATLHTS